MCDLRSTIFDVRSAAAPRQSAVGFTLVELLVVIAIIVLLLVVGMPAIGTMFASGRVTNAERSVSSAVAGAQAYATRELAVQGGEYRGAAAFFHPDNKVFLVKHTAYDLKKPLYTDIKGVDPVLLSPNIRVYGITRGNQPSVRKPPFAVRFNKYGHLMSRRNPSNPQDLVHYDANQNGTLNLGANVVPAEYENSAAVIGVVVFDVNDFLAAGYAEPTTVQWIDRPDAAYTWIIENGTTLLFNRYSGTVMKEQ